MGKTAHLYSDGVYTLVEVDYIDINRIIRQIYICKF